MIKQTESYSDRMTRNADAMLRILPDPDALIDAIERFAIFDECDNIYLLPHLIDAIRSDSDIDEMTAILDPD